MYFVITFNKKVNGNLIDANEKTINFHPRADDSRDEHSQLKAKIQEMREHGLTVKGYQTQHEE